MKTKITPSEIINAFNKLEEKAQPINSSDRDTPMEAKRKFSVMRNRLIYVCPCCGVRVRQFKERCFNCTQKLLWDIRVVK